ncbi:hypothetical protein [Nocardioides daphniae]|uniref:Lipoprotein n=1 Tax=Nocardioides daphniae TaxID=402297 RepID=A0A4P7UE94_9ACTN|nr:hypothetical protein [Nocardioides daphniae]QCC78446.1 hypothetical protein E2C04_16835 [Nocardioides daphniae]GGD12361.1 hypothetical protein GCM10007231_09160 [Nocardioides daphniae]
MRRFTLRTTTALVGTALAASLVAGCAQEPPAAEPRRSVSPEPSAEPSDSPSESPSESVDPEEPQEVETAVERPSPFRRIPDGLVETPSEVELGRLSVGGRDRLSGEKFAIAVAQFIVDTGEARNQGAVIDAVASPRLSETARDQVVADYDGQRGLQVERVLTADGETWMRSGTTGKRKAPREVRVELAGVMDNGVPDQVFVGAVRVDVVRRAGRWEVSHVAGPAVRAPLPTRLASVKPFLEGRHWRQLPAVGDARKPAAEPGRKPRPDRASAKRKRKR